MDKIKMSGQMIWIVLYTFGLDSCLGKLMVDLVGISRVSRDLPITKCLIPGVPDNLTLGHIPAWGRHLPSLAFSRTKSTFDTCNTANENPYFQLHVLWQNIKSGGIIGKKLGLTHISVLVAQIKKLKKADWHFLAKLV